MWESTLRRFTLQPYTGNRSEPCILCVLFTMAPILSSLIDVSLTLHTAWIVKQRQRFQE